MSDVEEPPTKMSKYEEYLEPEVEEGMEEEGQEEWLSEGVLTDDDYNPNPEHDQMEPAVSQEDSTMEELKPEVLEQSNQSAETQSEVTETKANIEETLNSLDSTRNGDELPEDLDAFLIRKVDGKVEISNVKDDIDVPAKQEEEDGNNTDDLLRVLGDGDQKLKKKIKFIKKLQKEEPGSSDDDDEFVYERSKVKTLKLAKNALMKRTPAAKAEPEEMSDGDDETEQSSDEGATVQRMFEVAKKGPSGKDHPKRVLKHVVQVNTNFSKNNSEPEKTKKLSQQKPIIKSQPKDSQKQTKPEVRTPAAFKPLEKKSERSKLDKDTTSKTYEYDEIINEAEFLDEEEFELDEEEFEEESESSGAKHQRIMKPERMDEEVPSDGESHSENGSLYDELPSSDSEDMDDWFSLDIRAERAGDYLPLLGTAARELLTAERQRVSHRVGSLRHSLAALTHSARRQADQVRAAAMALAEIDDTLRAS